MATRGTAGPRPDPARRRADAAGPGRPERARRGPDPAHRPERGRQDQPAAGPRPRQRDPDAGRVEAATGVALLPQTHEPTDYLDFDSPAVVEAALREFRGTVVNVSHDTWFAEAVGFDRRWRVADGRLVDQPV